MAVVDLNKVDLDMSENTIIFWLGYWRHLGNFFITLIIHYMPQGKFRNAQTPLTKVGLVEIENGCGRPKP
jgi:hypothetical protein